MNKKNIMMLGVMTLASVSAFAQGPTNDHVQWGVISAAFVLGISSARRRPSSSDRTPIASTPDAA